MKITMTIPTTILTKTKKSSRSRSPHGEEEKCVEDEKDKRGTELDEIRGDARYFFRQFKSIVFIA